MNLIVDVGNTRVKLALFEQGRLTEQCGAETLSAAMDARCYHGEQGRTRLHALAFGRSDALAAVVTALLLICVIVINLQLV